MSLKLSMDASGIDKAQKWLAGLQNQLPYAASRALNDVAKVAAADLNKSTTTYFDRPTRFTQNAYSVSSYSTKKNLEAVVSPRPIQSRYLTPSIVGGVRPQRPSERRLIGVTPSWAPGRDAKLNASGNMTKAALVKALKGGGQFFTLKNQRGKLRPGVYQRIKTGAIKQVLSFGKLPTIPKRWPVERIAGESITAAWAPALNKRMAEALRTVK